MAADVVFRLLHLVVHVGDLARAFVFGKFGIAVVGMQSAVDPVLRVSVVADVEFEPIAAAHRNELVEEHVVAHEPRRERCDSGEGDGDHLSFPRARQSVATVESPDPKQRKDGHHDRLGERGHAAESAEENPIALARGVLQAPSEQKQAAEF
jgi:hypothetical protein